jgi:hypothetical protein
MKLPRGDLVASRVVDDPCVALESAFADALTGYLVLEPVDTLLLEDDGAGILTFDDGVPVLAYHTTTERAGADALAALATPAPVKVDRRVVDARALAPFHDPAAPRGDDASTASERQRTASESASTASNGSVGPTGDGASGVMEAPVSDSVDADRDASVAHVTDSGRSALAVAPGEPARVLGGECDLAARTRERAPASHPGRETSREASDPLATFLANEDRVAALQAEAREEAERRAAEWGFTDELEG